MRTHCPRSLAITAGLALIAGACTETNLSGPAAPSAAGVIVFASNREDRNFEIYRINPDGRGLTRLTHDPEHNDYDPVLSRDGSRIAWEREIAAAGTGIVSTEIWVMNADGSDQHGVVSNGASNATPSWGAGDRTLVYASDVGGDWDIYSVPASGGAPTNLTNSPLADQYPRVSPDGSRVLFQTNRDLNFEIYSMAADGSDVRDLSNSTADDRFPAWTPDGQHVVWSRYIDDFDLWVMQADGSNQRTLISTPYAEVAPAVSPDGNSVVFQTDRVPPASLFILPLDGGPPRQLTNLPGSPGGTDFGPWWGGPTRSP